MALEFESPPEQPGVNVLLYGAGKTGKSWGAASAPGPILYINTDLPNAVRKVHERYGDKLKFAKWEGLQTLMDVGLLVKDDHPFKTVVLDTVGDTYRRLVEEFSNRALRPEIQYYGDAGTHLERFCRAMCANPTINFVAVCHEQPMKDEAAGHFERLPFTGSASNPTLGGKLQAMVDVVAYTGVVEGEGNSDPVFMAQLIPANGRRGGDRFDVLGKSRQVDLTEWIATIAHGGNGAAPSANGQTDDEPQAQAAGDGESDKGGKQTQRVASTQRRGGRSNGGGAKRTVKQATGGKS